MGMVPTGECPSGQEKDAGLVTQNVETVLKASALSAGEVVLISFATTARSAPSLNRMGVVVGIHGNLVMLPFDLSGARGRCEGDNGGGGTCEQDGAMCYPKCKAGFTKVGCCICSPCALQE